MVTFKKWQTEACTRAEQKKPPEIRAAHLAHSSLQNGIKAALWSISVAGNLLFLDFFIETVDFICQGQEVAEAKGWDTAGEQLITVGRTEEWSAQWEEPHPQPRTAPSSTRLVSKTLFRSFGILSQCLIFWTLQFLDIFLQNPTVEPILFCFPLEIFRS